MRGALPKAILSGFINIFGLKKNDFFRKRGRFFVGVKIANFTHFFNFLVIFLLLRKTVQTSSQLADTAANQYFEVLGKRFPNLQNLINENITDPRDSRGKIYSLPDLIGSSISLFALQQGSRNSYNLDRMGMSQNFNTLMGINLAHGDTCEDLLRRVDPWETNNLLAAMVRRLIESKLLHNIRFENRYLIAVDATGVHTFSDDQEGTALRKTSKNNMVSYSSAVLEAKLVGDNGFAISLCQEWISNEGNDFDKQDCEQKAFVRLAEKLKKRYPRLPIILLGDALYRSETVLNCCKKNNWDFIIVQKDNGLDYTREEIQLRPDKVSIDNVNEHYQYINDLEYNNHSISWLQYKKYTSTFAWYTSIPINKENIESIVNVGRNRWKIENQGFDEQKNHGYNLQHKYSRISPQARSNYYILLQIAHLINQLVLLEVRFKEATKKITRKKLWEYFRAFVQRPINKFEKLRHYLSRKHHQYKE